MRGRSPWGARGRGRRRGRRVAPRRFLPGRPPYPPPIAGGWSGAIQASRQPCRWFPAAAVGFGLGHGELRRCPELQAVSVRCSGADQHPAQLVRARPCHNWRQAHLRRTREVHVRNLRSSGTCPTNRHGHFEKTETFRALGSGVLPAGGLGTSAMWHVCETWAYGGPYYVRSTRRVNDPPQACRIRTNGVGLMRGDHASCMPL